MECKSFCRTPYHRGSFHVEKCTFKHGFRQNHIHVILKDLEPIFHMYEDLVPILQKGDKSVIGSSHM